MVPVRNLVVYMQWNVNYLGDGHMALLTFYFFS